MVPSHSYDTLTNKGERRGENLGYLFVDKRYLPRERLIKFPPHLVLSLSTLSEEIQIKNLKLYANVFLPRYLTPGDFDNDNTSSFLLR